MDTKQKIINKKIQEGGITFQCEECGINGVLSADLPIVKSLRKIISKDFKIQCDLILNNCKQHTHEKN